MIIINDLRFALFTHISNKKHKFKTCALKKKSKDKSC